MKYAIEQRLRFIDFLLAEYGYLNRSTLMNFFGISQPQASDDIRNYKERAPDNIVYDNRAKVYQRSETFSALWE